MTTENPFDELEALALRRGGPRFDPEKCGRCPACHLGPSGAFNWCSIWWYWCDGCQTRWADEHQTFAPRDLPRSAEEYEAVGEFLFDLATNTESLTPIPSQENSMPKAAVAFDPSTLLEVEPRELFPHCPKQWASGFHRPEFRRRVVGMITTEFAQHHSAVTRSRSDATRAALLIFPAVRHKLVAHKLTFEDAVTQAGAPIEIIRDVVLMLVEAGNLKATLLEQRRRIDALLEKLDAAQAVGQ